jgi:mitochondrial fission protein ELM1
LPPAKQVVALFVFGSLTQILWQEREEKENINCIEERFWEIQVMDVSFQVFVALLFHFVLL